MYGGIPVLKSPILPIAPGHREDARRMVRHGMAGVLRQLGEDVGPAPGAPTHGLMVAGRLHASADLIRELRARVAQD